MITSGHCSRFVGFLNRQSGQGPQAITERQRVKVLAKILTPHYKEQRPWMNLIMARGGFSKVVTLELRPEKDEDPWREVQESWGRETGFHGQSMWTRGY